eukprot:2389197-Amphidinium_carterae.1
MAHGEPEANPSSEEVNRRLQALDDTMDWAREAVGVINGLQTSTGAMFVPTGAQVAIVLGVPTPDLQVSLGVMFQRLYYGRGHDNHMQTLPTISP